MNVLVTGGLGYIGSHTVVELLNENYTVVVIDNLSNSKIDVIDKIKKLTNKDFEFYKLDAANEKDVEELFVKNHFDAVIHFAGFKAVNESIQNPLMYYENNLLSTIVISKLCVEHSVNKLVFSSSANVYGNNEAPFVETMDLQQTTNPYGETKAMGERILQDIVKVNNEFSVVLLRYFNPIGAHETGLLYEDINGIPSNLMPYIVQVANGQREKLYIYGDDYDTLDGTGVRDYIHVVDLARGHVLALEKMKKGVSIYNLGTGTGYTVLQVVEAFKKVNNVDIPYDIVDRRKGDIAVGYADATKAEKELGFKAKYSIEEMCKHSYNAIKLQ